MIINHFKIVLFSALLVFHVVSVLSEDEDTAAAPEEHPNDVESDPIPEEPVDMCPDGHTFKIDCNYCICDSPTGKRKCTTMHCSKKDKDECPHGTKWMDDCNTCWCDSDTGHSACTLMSCFSSPILTRSERMRSKQFAPPVCPDGAVYHPDECNTCYCNIKTGIIRCTGSVCDSDSDDMDE